ncbi:MAG: glycosyltransferase [Bacteroidota bacterium]
MQKVLIVAYYWPPAGGPGVQRWLKFVNYLPEFGVTPIVFVPKNARYPIEDPSLMDQIPPKQKVIQHPIAEPYKLAALFSGKKTRKISSGIISPARKQSFLEQMFLWIRGNIFIPDARKFWVKPAVSRLEKIIKNENISTVITTGPPHSIHLIGLRLKKKLNVHWLADFRDPWTSIGYHKKLRLTAAARKKHKYLERIVLQSADQIVVTSSTTKEEFAGLTSRPIQVITNGYDTERYAVALDKKFTLSHIGSLLTDRNPRLLWEVLSELVKEHPAIAKTLQIQLVGVVGEEVINTLKAIGLEQYVTKVGYLPHDQVLEYQWKSQILLLLEIDSRETQGIIPGKLFEYLNAGRPILAIGPEGWEAGKMVAELEAGVHIRNTEKEPLKKVLLAWFQKFQKEALTVQMKNTASYHRRELTKQLANLLQWESS